MKKKLLSLVLAGAMVASTSVSAFATESPAPSQDATNATVSQTPSPATGQKEYKVTETDANADIKIEGRIANSSNVLPPSTINVTVPTAASFTVDNTGKLIGSTITITSEGTEEVEVLAYKFSDSTGDSGIKVVDSDTLSTENRKNSEAGTTPDRKMVSLSLRGENTVSLITDSSTNTNRDTNKNKSGIYKYNTKNEATEDSDRKVGTVSSSKSLTLNLEGKAVTGGSPLGDAVSDNFTLTLKLKKVNSKVNS